MSSVPNVKSDNILMWQFTGTKTVKAGVCSRKCAEELIGRKMRPDSDEIEDEPGYLVIYPDGYKSWSPKKVFEEAYQLSESFIDRMKIEQEEVKKRYLDGRAFSFTQKFRDLNDKQKNLLHKQLSVMEDYLYILGERISYEEHGIVPPCTSDK
jgi:hypothetical protein